MYICIEQSTTGWNVHGLPRQHSDVWLWVFPKRLIILVYVSFDILLVFPPAFVKVRPRSVRYVTICTLLIRPNALKEMTRFAEKALANDK
jgi:hypothetical protein